MAARENKGPHRNKLKHWQFIAVLMMLYDFIAIHLSYFMALWIRFDCVFSEIPQQYFVPYRRSITIYAVFCVAIFCLVKMYNSMWRYASYIELIRTLTASVGTSLLHALLITVLFARMPLSYYLWGMILQFIFLIGIRFSYRLLLFLRSSPQTAEEAKGRVMLIGAGAAGQMILRDINQAKQIQDRVVCVIDDNSNKWNRFMDGVPIVGGRNDILTAVEKYKIQKIYLAIPSAPAKDKRDILNLCNETGCELKQLPGMYQVVLGQVTVSAMKDVAVEDLLGREPVRADMREVFQFINGKTILVTGGGGSIGSELCRQIAAHGPKQLILFDVYENNAYEVQLELRERDPMLDLKVIIGSVRDFGKLLDVFRTYKPDIVYHAAAHKHVPLMEDSPCEAIKNNVLGTYNTAYAAMLYGCKRFVLISTDKAVNPTNIMGASKRLCEMVVQSFDKKVKTGTANEIPQPYEPCGYLNSIKPSLQRTKTEFVAVRFGNVLGSNGSVIPIFKKQIEKGGPVTVTHPDIIRYFMTIPEAVSLVLLAGTYAKGGEIFVLDMGDPVKIDTLARNLIKLAGYKPDVDIKIAYVGLRPGEKLYEEKLMAEEGLRRTENAKIHIGRPVPFDEDVFLRELRELVDAAYRNDRDIRNIVAELVGTYHSIKAEGIIMPVQASLAVNG